MVRKLQDMYVCSRVASLTVNDNCNRGPGFWAMLEQAWPNVKSLSAEVYTLVPRPFWARLQHLELTVMSPPSKSSSCTWPELSGLSSLSIIMVGRCPSTTDAHKRDFFVHMVIPALRASRNLARISIIHEDFVSGPQGLEVHKQTMMDLIEQRHRRPDLLALVLDPAGPLFPRVVCRKLQLGCWKKDFDSFDDTRLQMRSDLLARTEAEDLDIFWSLGTMARCGVKFPQGVVRLKVAGAFLPFIDAQAANLRELDFLDCSLTETQVAEIVRACTSLEQVKAHFRCELVYSQSCSCQRCLRSYLGSVSLRRLELRCMNCCIRPHTSGRFCLDTNAMLDSSVQTFVLDYASGINFLRPETLLGAMKLKLGREFRGEWTLGQRTFTVTPAVLRLHRK
jgi:hypothetical protein